MTRHYCWAKTMFDMRMGRFVGSGFGLSLCAVFFVLPECPQGKVGLIALLLHVTLSNRRSSVKQNINKSLFRVFR